MRNLVQQRAAQSPLRWLAFLPLLATTQLSAQAPSIEQRAQVLKSLVQVTASDCADGTRRSGSGFALERASRVVTAHHVVGGCRTIIVSYEAALASSGKLQPAQLVRVLSSGDLALLQVNNPPAVPSLRITSAPAALGITYFGSGYANGMPTAGDLEVRFSVGASRLRDILPPDSADELRRIGSQIATDREVLRFNVALQPGMSGGPIVNAAGEVIGVIAGGLKAGAAPASWGWPGDWVRTLLVSNEPVDRAVRLAGAYYTMSELEQIATARRSGRRVSCGELEFVDHGRRDFSELAHGADDKPRLEHIINLSRESRQAIDRLKFQVWVHEGSGATALVPAGYDFVRAGEVCVARSNKGPFQLVVWAAKTPSPPDVQLRSQEFEMRVMAPRTPYTFGFQVDSQLTTLVQNPSNGLLVPGPQLRDNGMVFNRKGFIQPKRAMMHQTDVVPQAHSFETLVAKAGTFLGVGTVNDEIHPVLNACLLGNNQFPGCDAALRHLNEWTHFVLATQLSTYPVY